MIREARIDEVRKVAEFMKQFEQHTGFVKVDVNHATKQYERFYATGIGIMIILEDDNTGELYGGIGAIALPDIHCGIMTAVETFWFVSPEHRGQGLKLLKAFEDWGKKMKCKRLALIHLADSYPEILEKIYIRKKYKLVEKHFIREV